MISNTSNTAIIDDVMHDQQICEEFYTCAIIDEKGNEIPITECMVQKSLAQIESSMQTLDS